MNDATEDGSGRRPERGPLEEREPAWPEDPRLWRPRGPRFGEIRVVGHYELPGAPESGLSVLEVIVRKPPWMVDLSDWAPYEPAGWDEEWHVGRPDFYLSADGEELIGSYLHRPPSGDVTRFALVLRGVEEPALLSARKIRVPEYSPIPERLLRLISLDG